MTYLLDVNVLIALFDTLHVNHEAAHNWFARCGKQAWATCPLTENGFVRIVSHPRYPTVQATPAQAVARLTAFVQNSSTHTFWADDVSLRDSALFVPDLVAGPGQLTDVYLLGLAERHGGKLATFDTRIRADVLRPRSSDAIELIDG
jgi:toxin-antitoxin system PIN domain toxin